MQADAHAVILAAVADSLADQQPARAPGLGQQRADHLDIADPLARQLAHFCQVIRGQAEPLVSVRDGLRNLQVIDAIGQAARCGHTVMIDSL